MTGGRTVLNAHVMRISPVLVPDGGVAYEVPSTFTATSVPLTPGQLFPPPLPLFRALMEPQAPLILTARAGF